MIADCRGLLLSSTSDEAVRLFDRGVHRYLEYRSDTADLLTRASAADPEFAMPRVLLATCLQTMGTLAVRPKIDALIDEIDGIERPLLEREALHVAALRTWVAGDLDGATKIWNEITVRWPRDLMAIRALHYQNFWRGACRDMRSAVAGTLHAWDERDPGYGFLLGMLAFGIEECGDYERAEALGRQAVALNGEDMWSIHAVAHVMEMQGRLDEGERWLGFSPGRWDDRGPFRTHLWWHAALFAHEQGRFDRVLDLYDEQIRHHDDSKVCLEVMNCASLLARLDFQGVDVGDRWERLAERTEPWIDDHVIAFTDCHTMFPLARTGRFDVATRFEESLEEFARANDGYAAGLMEPMVLPIARAIRAFYGGEPARAVELLKPLRNSDSALGGSHAQRDVFHQLLLAASIAAGDWPLARSLAQERVTLRPHNHLDAMKLAHMLTPNERARAVGGTSAS